MKGGAANANAVSVRVEFLADAKVSGQRRHDLRIGHTPKYVDNSRSIHNSIIVEPMSEAHIRAECERRRNANGNYKRRMKRGVAVASTAIITFGSEAQRIIAKLSPQEQNEYFKQAAEAVAARMGTTVSGLSVHRDESAIHAHIQMPAYSVGGVSLSHARDAQMYSDLQDVVAQVYAHLGIERGYRQSQRRALGALSADLVHRSVKQLHKDLPEELAQAQASLERNLQLADRARAALVSTRRNTEKLRRRAARYEARAAKAREQITRANALLKQINAPHPEKVERVVARRRRRVGTEEVVTQMVSMVPASSAQQAMRHMAARAQQAEARATEVAQQLEVVQQEIQAQVEERQRLEEALRMMGEMLYTSGQGRPNHPVLQTYWDESAWQHQQGTQDEGRDGSSASEDDMAELVSTLRFTVDANEQFLSRMEEAMIKVERALEEGQDEVAIDLWLEAQMLLATQENEDDGNDQITKDSEEPKD